MFHGVFFGVAIAHHHHRPVFGVQRLSQARRFGVRCNDLAGMCVVSRNHHQGVAVFLRKLQRLLHRFIQIDRFADLTTRIRSVILFIDRRAFHLQEETFIAFV